MTESNVQAVRDQMSAPKLSRILDELLKRQPNGGIVSADNRARARAHDDIDRNLMGDEPLQDADVAGATQTSSAEDQGEPNLARGGVDRLRCG